jgi:ABC-type sugar transport system substrate-binding protein
MSPVPLIPTQYPTPRSSFYLLLHTSALLGVSLALFSSLVQSAQAEKQLRIGVAMKTLNAPYFAAQGKAAEEEAKKLGASVISADSQDDIMKQIAGVQGVQGVRGVQGVCQKSRLLDPGF